VTLCEGEEDFVDYTAHVSWPYKRPDFWKTWGLLSCLALTMFGPLCYASAITESVAKNGFAEAKFPEFSLQNCCSKNILLWLCYISVGIPLALVGLFFVLLDWQFIGRFFCSLATLSYFIYLPAFLICGASDSDHPSLYSSFFKLPFSKLTGYYKLVFIYMLWQGFASAIVFPPAVFIGIGIGLAIKSLTLGIIVICASVLLVFLVVFAAQSYILMAISSLVGEYMRINKGELIEKDILDEKTFLMSGSLEE